MNMKKILYIDMDGVLADLGKAVYDINEYCPAKRHLDEDRFDEIIQSNRNIFKVLEPLEGAIESVKQLMEIYEVYFLSTPMWALPESFTDKRLWLEDTFGKLAKKRLILTHRKDLNIGSYLIDDRLKNGASEFKGEHIHFGTESFQNWESVLSYLKEKESIIHTPRV